MTRTVITQILASCRWPCRQIRSPAVGIEVAQQRRFLRHPGRRAGHAQAGRRPRHPGQYEPGLARTPDEAADKLWRFVCQCHVDRTHDHVAPFIAEHAREILELTCYLPVEYLEVEAETGIVGLRVLPTTSDEIPQQGRRFVLDPPIRCLLLLSTWHAAALPCAASFPGAGNSAELIGAGEIGSADVEGVDVLVQPPVGGGRGRCGTE